MAKFVNDVFVGAGSTATTDPASQTIGSIVMLNQDGEIVTSTNVADATSIAFGVVSGPAADVVLPDGTISNLNRVRFSDDIKIEEIFTPGGYSYIPYAAATEQVSTVTLGATITPNTRYTVKVIFRDNQGTKTQITKTFDYVVGDSVGSTTNATIMTSIASRINKHSKGLLVATAAAGVLTITGAKRLDNPGKNTLNLYSQNIFEIAAYSQSTNDYFSSASNADMTVVTTTKASKGAGTFELVRDAERTNLPYQGYENPLAFPVNAPDLVVDPAKTYDTIVIEYNKKYFSADNQYIKTTPKSVELYLEVGTGSTILSNLSTLFS